jgi:formiminoglutamase
MSFQYIESPRLIERHGGSDRMDWKVSRWIAPWDGKEEMVAGIVGFPFLVRRSALLLPAKHPTRFVPFGARLTPYDADHDGFVPDDGERVGKICMHTTDIFRCHQNILRGWGELYERTAAH